MLVLRMAHVTMLDGFWKSIQGLQVNKVTSTYISSNLTKTCEMDNNCDCHLMFQRH